MLLSRQRLRAGESDQFRQDQGLQRLLLLARRRTVGGARLTAGSGAVPLSWPHQEASQARQ